MLALLLAHSTGADSIVVAPIAIVETADIKFRLFILPGTVKI